MSDVDAEEQRFEELCSYVDARFGGKHELSVRAANCLESVGIKTFAHLVVRTEADLLRMKNFGRKSINEIKGILKDGGLSLGTLLDGDLLTKVNARLKELGLATLDDWLPEQRRYASSLNDGSLKPVPGDQPPTAQAQVGPLTAAFDEGIRLVCRKIGQLEEEIAMARARGDNHKEDYTVEREKRAKILRYALEHASSLRRAIAEAERD